MRGVEVCLDCKRYCLSLERDFRLGVLEYHAEGAAGKREIKERVAVRTWREKERNNWFSYVRCV